MGGPLAPTRQCRGLGAGFRYSPPTARAPSGSNRRSIPAAGNDRKKETRTKNFANRE